MIIFISFLYLISIIYLNLIGFGLIFIMLTIRFIEIIKMVVDGLVIVLVVSEVMIVYALVVELLMKIFVNLMTFSIQISWLQIINTTIMIKHIILIVINSTFKMSLMALLFFCFSKQCYYYFLHYYAVLNNNYCYLVKLNCSY